MVEEHCCSCPAPSYTCCLFIGCMDREQELRWQNLEKEGIFMTNSTWQGTCSSVVSFISTDHRVAQAPDWLLCKTMFRKTCYSPIVAPSFWYKMWLHEGRVWAHREAHINANCFKMDRNTAVEMAMKVIRIQSLFLWLWIWRSLKYIWTIDQQTKLG